MSFDNWKARLAGKTVTTYLQPQLEDEGYYRKPITEPVLGANGKTNGQKRIIGWTPVAYFIDRGMLCGVIGDRDMAANEVSDEGLWSYVCRHPIKEEVFRAVAERGEPWPDLVLPVGLDPAARAEAEVREGKEAKEIESRIVDDIPSIGHNKPPEVEPHIQHAEAIDNAVRAAEDLKATDETTAAIVLGAKNRLAELRLAADKAGHAIYDPLHKAYKEAQKPWPLMVAKAVTMEAKLNRLYLEWRAAEKKKADEAEALRVAEAKRIEEENERAAQRAIARGEPEPPPAAPEVSPATTPAPAPVTPTYRAAGQRTTPREVEKWWLDGIDDWAKVYEFFKDNADVKAALEKAAKAAVTNGQEVPGTRRHFGLI